MSGLGAAPHPNGMSRSDQPISSVELPILSGVVLICDRWLSTALIDSLADAQQDWICRLQSDWAIELQTADLPHVRQLASSADAACKTLHEVVTLTHPVSYQPLVVGHSCHWVYSSCMRLVGLGRTRVVIAYGNSLRSGQWATFLSNRLDWSPRKIMSYWAEQESLTDLYANACSLTRLASTALA